MNNNPSHPRQGFSLVIVIAVGALVLGILAVVFLLLPKDQAPQSALGELPSEEKRVNPLPLGPNILEVDTVAPGSKLTVSNISLSRDAYIVVKKQQDTGTKEVIGKSRLYKAGQHQDVLVGTALMVDGDVVYISFQDINDKEIVDENNNPIEVLKNVGMLAGHEMGEANDYY